MKGFQCAVKVLLLYNGFFKLVFRLGIVVGLVKGAFPV